MPIGRHFSAASGAVVIVATGLFLLNCSQLEKSMDSIAGGGDISRDVHATDLSARSPRPIQSSGGDDPPARMQIYPGSQPEEGGNGPAGRAAASGTAQASAVRSGEGYSLNFENADIAAVAKALLGDVLGVGYSVDQRVQGTMSLASGRPVPRSDIIPLFESALKTANANLVKEGGLYKIVPLGEALGAGSTDRGKPEPGYGISVLPLRHISGQAVVRALESFATRPGAIRVDQSRNVLLIQGTSTERAAAIETAMALDVDWMKSQSVGVFPVRNTSPEAVIPELQNIFDSGKEGSSDQQASSGNQGNSGSSNAKEGGAAIVRFQPINRLNAVLAIATTPDRIAQVQQWVERLDKSDYSNNALRVYRVRFGKAQLMSNILREVFTGQAASTTGLPGTADLSQLTPGSTTQGSSSGGFTMNQSSGSTSQSGYQQTGTSQPDSSSFDGGDQSQQTGAVKSPTTPTSTAGGPTGAIPAFANVRISADTANNSLLIYASRDQYKVIQKAIFELDKASLQVAIEATVAEVTLKNELRYGVQFYLKGAHNGKQVGSIGFGQSDVLKRLIPGANLVLGSDQDPRVVIDAFRQLTDVKVLSSPSLVVLDNQSAQLQVGDQVPIVTQSGQSVISPDAPIVNNVEMRDTGVILRVTPRVSVNGVVTLDVEQEISNVVNPGEQTLTPTIARRRVKSSIAVASGQTVLLGGLISNRTNRTKSGIPILSELKGVGDLFAVNSGSSERTEIIIFIRPQIIRDGIDAQLVAEELRSKLSMMGQARPKTPVARKN